MRVVARLRDSNKVLALDFPERKRGFALMALAITLLATMDLLVKLLSTRYAVTQIVWARYVLQSLTFVAVTGFVGITASLRSDVLPAHLGRAALLLVGNVSFVLALRYLPLTEANVIGFASPLIITALSYPVLGQRVSARRWLAVIVGFAGILIVMQPGQSLFQWAALWPVVMAATAAVYHITTPLISRHDDPAISVYILSVAGALALTAAVPFAWTTPGPLDALGLAGIGVLGAFGQILIIKAFVLSPAASLAPFFYVYLIWAVIYGYLVFGDVPTATTLVGAALVVGGGIYVYRHA
jgi:drug/metabolite transporter (DMT)-like permease